MCMGVMHVPCECDSSVVCQQSNWLIDVPWAGLRSLGFSVNRKKGWRGDRNISPPSSPSYIIKKTWGMHTANDKG